MAKEYRKLIGRSVIGNKNLRSTEAVAEFICRHGIYGDLKIITEDGKTLIKTNQIYVTDCTDEEYLTELNKILLPMQKITEETADLESYNYTPESEESEMGM